MRPSEVRTRVLADHERLRRDLERLEALSNGVSERRGDARVAALREEAQSFLVRLREHMRWEEAHLLPALRDADAWGRERAERLQGDHREQRELLDFIVARLRDRERPGPVVARDVAGLIDLLREDMREEEEALLDERVLRDDVVAIAMETG